MEKIMSGLKGKVYPYYFVQCGFCGQENPLGVTLRNLVDFHLVRSGYKKVRNVGYMCFECRNRRKS